MCSRAILPGAMREPAVSAALPIGVGALAEATLQVKIRCLDQVESAWVTVGLGAAARS